MLERIMGEKPKLGVVAEIEFSIKPKKEGTFVADYMNKMTSIVDDLALIDHPLSDTEITAHILNGHVDEFKELTAAIHVRDSPITFEDLYDKLTDEELI
ncbi:hypothetical protein Ddye_025951 [Dipteronia dyeriana]|uniref:Uncharacterized protein n=1 Tax=Dipteronia dyeriana TaxID=168575 RepID=A0AAD9TLB8_9ROSI|nr:hypothetical protein Ddye_025951 [Dipteronia dyeriana]